MYGFSKCFVAFAGAGCICFTTLWIWNAWSLHVGWVHLTSWSYHSTMLILRCRTSAAGLGLCTRFAWRSEASSKERYWRSRLEGRHTGLICKNRMVGWMPEERSRESGQFWYALFWNYSKSCKYKFVKCLTMLDSSTAWIICKKNEQRCRVELNRQELQTLAGRVAMVLGCRRNYTTSSPEISPAFLLLLGDILGKIAREADISLLRAVEMDVL